MQNDFKENYIKQQEELAAQRRARLSRIGMGPDASSSGASAETGRPAQPMQRPAQPMQRPAQPMQRPAQPMQRPAQPMQRPAQPMQRPAQPMQRPAQPMQRPAQPMQRPAQPMQRPAQPMQRPAQPMQRPAQPMQRPAQPMQRPAQPMQRTAQPMQRTAQPMQRPAQPMQRTNQPIHKPLGTFESVYGAADTQRRNTRDEGLFKGEISENDSRTMMFSLTGRAEHPDNGGEVDIINMGRIPAPKKIKPIERKKRLTAKTVILRTLGSIGSILLFVVIAVFSSVLLIAHGPSATIRDALVISADQTSAAKWVPYLFLDSGTVKNILHKSEETVQDKVSMEDYNASVDVIITEDEWEKAKDGMIFETYSGPTFKAYVLLVKDPSRVFVGTSAERKESDPSAQDASTIFEISEFYGAIATINGGEFPDYGGGGTGTTPIGITYSKGECVHNDGYTDRTFLGITKDNKLVVCEGMTKKKADELGIRDGVSFQKGNTLIQNDGSEIIRHRQDGNTGTAQRTGIGQRADGTIILVVTDGRTASSLGATHNDMIDLMESYGAVTAGLLDGGSSSLMYYRDYYNKYDYDVSKLDKYQLMGLVNNFKAFTEPRRIPTFFVVKPEE